ncbi:hypothetical protein [Streptomyces griseochromogenes]|uniref:hypothetical protein n=1 Tax=Streptomyces griseochromogenes TaxID=68214 RepID=UPI0037A1B4FA
MNPPALAASRGAGALLPAGHRCGASELPARERFFPVCLVLSGADALFGRPAWITALPITHRLEYLLQSLCGASASELIGFVVFVGLLALVAFWVSYAERRCIVDVGRGGPGA